MTFYYTAVAEEKARNGYDGHFSEQLVRYDPRRYNT